MDAISPKKTPMHDLLRNSLQIRRQNQKISAEILERTGLTDAQCLVLQATAENEGVTQTELVEETGVDRSTMGNVLRRLDEKYLTRRTRNKKDKRANVVKATARGVILYNKIMRS